MIYTRATANLLTNRGAGCFGITKPLIPATFQGTSNTQAVTATKLSHFAQRRVLHHLVVSCLERFETEATGKFRSRRILT